MAGAKLYVSTSTMETSTQPDVCANDDPAACEPECLVQPRFFCGQLLTDQDLSALLNWNIGKYKLDRYKQGWGVVEGLQVHCNPEEQGSVIVNPGYAVDSCGNDINICDPTVMDISKACKPSHAHCESLYESADDNSNSVFGLPVSDGEPYYIDIFLHYNTEACEPLPALGRGACSEREACEFSRKKESFKLSWQYADLEKDWFETELCKWEKDYYVNSRAIVPCIMNAWNSVKSSGDTKKAEVMKAAFCRWFEKHPLHEFCFLKDAANNMASGIGSGESSNSMTLEGKATEILFWAIMDSRIGYLSKRPLSVSPDAGLPIARVKLLRHEDDPRSCTVQHIDNMPPRRLSYRNDRWPALTGKFNLGQLVWRRVEDACSILRDKSISVSSDDLYVPQTIEQLNNWLNNEWQHKPESGDYCGLFTDVDCDYEKIELLTYSSDQLGKRVVSFQCATKIPQGEGRSISHRQMEKLVVAEKKSEAKPVEPKRELQQAKVEDDDMVDIEVHIPELADIKGIGPSYEKKLHSIGIKSVEDLATYSVEDLVGHFPRVSEEELQHWINIGKEFI